MKNKMVIAILAIGLAAGISAGAATSGTHLVTSVPANTIENTEITEVSTDGKDAEEKAEKEAAEMQAAEENAEKEAAKKKAVKEKAEKKTSKEIADKKAVEEKAEKEAAEKKAVKEKAEKEAAEKEAARIDEQNKAAIIVDNEVPTVSETVEDVVDVIPAEVDAGQIIDEKEMQRQAEEEARRQAEAEANKTQTVKGNVTSIDGNTLQVRAEGCNITVLIGSAEKDIKDTIEVGDEVTVVIKGQMTEKGWNATKIVDNTTHS